MLADITIQVCREQLFLKKKNALDLSRKKNNTLERYRLIQRDWNRAAAEISESGRLVQRSFWRAFRRNAEGDIDESLIPEELLAWYDDTEDEEETVEEVDSDVQEGVGA